MLLSADLIALLSRDGPKWDSVIPGIGNLIKAAVAWTVWETNKDGNFSLEILQFLFKCQRKPWLLCLLNTVALGLFATIIRLLCAP